MILVSTIILLLLNRHAEDLMVRLINEYVGASVKSYEVSLLSLNSDKYLYEYVNTKKEAMLNISSGSAIRQIYLIFSNTQIVKDSTDPQSIGKKMDPAIQHLPVMDWESFGQEFSDVTDDRDRIMRSNFEGAKAKYTILIVISMKSYINTRNEINRERSLALLLVGIFSLIVIYIFITRFTRPITVLSRAAKQVSAGNLDFVLPEKGPHEISSLTATFNEMLVGLHRNRDLEDQLQKSERSAMVGRFASGIAHEIRNPLNFINLSIDYLRDKFEPPKNKQQYVDMLNTIKEELARMNRLVSDFLSYGRPSKLKLTEINAESVVNEIRSLINAQSDTQNVTIDVRFNGSVNGGPVDNTNKDEKHNAVFIADPEQVKTCFSNLMINAVQAMSKGGELQVDITPNSSTIDVIFKDTGPGIAPDALLQIFEPYYSTKETGIGLGLPLTKKIIEEHGGTIKVESELNKGTTFTVTMLRKPE